MVVTRQERERLILDLYHNQGKRYLIANLIVNSVNLNLLLMQEEKQPALPLRNDFLD